MAQNKLQTANLAIEELTEELKHAEADYKKLRFDHATTGIENPLQLVEVRRNIARIKTELRARVLASASQEELANRSKIRARRRRQKEAASIAKRKARAGKK